MTTAARRGGPKAAPALKKVEEGLNKVRDRNHLVDNIAQAREAIQVAVARAVAEAMRDMRPPSSPMPRWATVTLSIGGGLVTLCTLAGIAFAMVQSYASTQVQGQQVQARITGLETWRTEMVALNFPTELQALKQLSRQRDEQIAQLRAADGQTAAETRQLLTAVTQLTTRMDDVLRQLGEVKSRLDRGAFLPPQRQSAPQEEPAVWRLPLSRGA